MSPANSPAPTGWKRDPVFYAAVLVLTLLCLWPIWNYRFLPMQDYPQHLFLSYVLNTYNAPGFDWGQHYQVNLHWGPYSLEYLLIHAFSAVMNIEAAGKLFISLYVVLMGTVVGRAVQRLPGEHTPWALLLFFPLVFNQTYFLGFQNFLLSLPLLFLALLDLEDFSQRPLHWASALRQGGYLFALFLCHPFSVLMYLAFASVGAAFLYPDRARVLRTLGPIAILGAVFLAWMFTNTAAPSTAQHREWTVWWWPFEALWKFYLIMFTGMRVNNGIDPYTTVLWIAVAAVLLTSVLYAQQRPALRCKYAACSALALTGYGVLPFWFGYYAFFNVRLAPVSLLFLALWCAALRFTRWAGYAMAILCAALVLVAVQIQGQVEQETAEILPILEKMERNARVLPLYSDASTRVLDVNIFYHMHAHDHNYYHILVGGGANPNLFPNPMLPVQYRSDIRLPFPEENSRLPFIWENYRPYYRYLLVRGNAPPLHDYLAQYLARRARSGAWTLYENPHAP